MKMYTIGRDIPLPPNLFNELTNFEKSRGNEVLPNFDAKCFLGLYKTDWKFVWRIDELTYHWAEIFLYHNLL
jgi:hypothetical protein